MSTEQQERRAVRRFALHLPMTITVLAGVPVQHAARSHDLSTHGILFHTDGDMPPGTPLEFVLAMPPEITGSDSIRVRCRGRVVRVRPEADGSSLAVAATIEAQEYVLPAELA